MALADTITLNVGNPAADRVFERVPSSGNSALYYADSPNNDLAGRPSLLIEHKELSGGLVQSTIRFKHPTYDATSETYPSFNQAVASVTRPATADLADIDEILEEVQEIFAITDFRTDIGEASY
jgi:hypothetical protein